MRVHLCPLGPKGSPDRCCGVAWLGMSPSTGRLMEVRGCSLPLFRSFRKRGLVGQKPVSLSFCR